MDDRVRVQLLGTRGSVSAGGEEFVRYGGGTSCVLVRMGGEVIFLDAGTGILAGEKALSREEKTLHILIGHPHLDHLAGLPFFTPLYEQDREINVFGRVRGGLSPRSQLERIMSPPLWPVGPEVFAAQVDYRELTEEAFAIGPVRVTTLEGDHPGGGTVYKLSWGGRSIVYAVDFEHGPRTAALAEFADRCDLLIYDAMFTTEEYENRKGFGHSTWEEGLALGLHTGAGRVVLTHHEPRRRDAEIDALQQQLNTAQAAAGWTLPEDGARPRCVFGKSGEEFFL